MEKKMTGAEVRERLGLTPGQFRTWVSSLQLDPELTSGNTHLFTPDDMALLAYAKPLRLTVKPELPWEEIRRRFEAEHPTAHPSRKGAGVGPDLAEVLQRLDRLTAALPEQRDLHQAVAEAVRAAMQETQAQALAIAESSEARLEKFAEASRAMVEKLQADRDAQAEIVRLQGELLAAQQQLAALQAPPEKPKGFLARLFGG
jgi:DNA-binding transcriptional MerR regulator